MSSVASNSQEFDGKHWSLTKSSLPTKARADVIVNDNGVFLSRDEGDIPGWRTNYIRTKMFSQRVSSKRAETARRMSSIRGPFPPSPSSYPYKSMARELIELGKMYTDGLLTKDEFMKAKADLVN